MHLPAYEELLVQQQFCRKWGQIEVKRTELIRISLSAYIRIVPTGQKRRAGGGRNLTMTAGCAQAAGITYVRVLLDLWIRCY